MNSESACEMHQTQTFVHLTKDSAATQESLVSGRFPPKEFVVRCTKLKHLFISYWLPLAHRANDFGTSFRL